ncbi:frataxin homolog, mitochondrial [Drosophila santomea]|uniref:frataxin homolog, mitochondrial n=1 Tax=Drosophila santomea TaxID=129105 RepID=UPI0019536DBB|nr:frataxin homolog, mitochondrial [Drosophila santomea]
MFAGRLLVRLSRSRACLATMGSWSKPQALANQMILSRTPPTSTDAIQCKGSIANRRFFSSEIETESTLDGATYERVCSDTLDALSDYFEELTENAAELQGTDVAYSDGVLTVNLGHQHGTYVINRQTPNKQIWLSSPTSGPKRYDFVGTVAAGRWVYKHSGQSLHELLQQEIPGILKSESVDFLHLPYCS